MVDNGAAEFADVIRSAIVICGRMAECGVQYASCLRTTEPLRTLHCSMEF